MNTWKDMGKLLQRGPILTSAFEVEEENKKDW
jgi:hypothetical protein